MGRGSTQADPIAGLSLQSIEEAFILSRWSPAHLTDVSNSIMASRALHERGEQRELALSGVLIPHM